MADWQVTRGWRTNGSTEITIRSGGTTRKLVIDKPTMNVEGGMDVGNNITFEVIGKVTYSSITPDRPGLKIDAGTGRPDGRVDVASTGSYGQWIQGARVTLYDDWAKKSGLKHSYLMEDEVSKYALFEVYGVHLPTATIAHELTIASGTEEAKLEFLRDEEWLDTQYADWDFKVLKIRDLRDLDEYYEKENGDE